MKSNIVKSCVLSRLVTMNISWNLLQILSAVKQKSQIFFMVFRNTRRSSKNINPYTKCSSSDTKTFYNLLKILVAWPCPKHRQKNSFKLSSNWNLSNFIESLVGWNIHPVNLFLHISHIPSSCRNKLVRQCEH